MKTKKVVFLSTRATRRWIVWQEILKNCSETVGEFIIGVVLGHQNFKSCCDRFDALTKWMFSQQIDAMIKNYLVLHPT